MYTPEKSLDRMLDWWMKATEDYLGFVKRSPLFLQWMGFSLQQHLTAKRQIDLLLHGWWRQVGLPPVQEITRLHERLNRIESKLGGLGEEHLPGMMQPIPGGFEKTPVRRLA